MKMFYYRSHIRNLVVSGDKYKDRYWPLSLETRSVGQYQCRLDVYLWRCSTLVSPAGRVLYEVIRYL